MTRVRLAIANSTLVRYPEAGGHLSVRLQYLMALRDLGIDVLWLELFEKSDSPKSDAVLVGRFYEQLRAYDVDRLAVVCAFDRENATVPVADMQPIGRSNAEFAGALGKVDLLWNLCGALDKHQIADFPRTAYIDLDPGHLQVSAQTWDLGLAEHDVRLTIGQRIGLPDCGIPDLGLDWKTFLPFVHLPMWDVTADPGSIAPITSVTQWTWAELWHQGQVFSISKRDAYLRYLDLPARCGRPLQLAVNMHADDNTGDRQLLLDHGWDLVDPHVVVGTADRYRSYIRESRAELSCPKPIFREMRTGWVSDRSIAYLASGRPVIAEDTGYSDCVPVGSGLVPFNSADEAVEGIRAVDSDFKHHSSEARRLSESYFDGRYWLPRMIEACR